MKFHLTLLNDQGFMLEHTLSLPVTDDIKWHDFENLRAVRDLLLLNPQYRLHDVTPDGMAAWYTDAEAMSRQLELMGIKKSFKNSGQAEYTALEEQDQDLE